MTTFTYWLNVPRGFANEYTVGIASTYEARREYRKRGYERIDRKRALKELNNRGDAATQMFVGVSLDASDFPDHIDRFELVKIIRDGSLPEYVRRRQQ